MLRHEFWYKLRMVPAFVLFFSVQEMAENPSSLGGVYRADWCYGTPRCRLHQLRMSWFTISSSKTYHGEVRLPTWPAFSVSSLSKLVLN